MLLFPVISLACGCVWCSRAHSNGWMHKPSKAVGSHQPFGGGYLQHKVNLRHTCNNCVDAVWHIREIDMYAFCGSSLALDQLVLGLSRVEDNKLQHPVKKVPFGMGRLCLLLPACHCLHGISSVFALHLPPHLCPARLGSGRAGTGIELVSLPAAVSGPLSPPPGPRTRTMDLTYESEQAKNCASVCKHPHQALWFAPFWCLFISLFSLPGLVCYFPQSLPKSLNLHTPLHSTPLHDVQRLF